MFFATQGPSREFHIIYFLHIMKVVYSIQTKWKARPIILGLDRPVFRKGQICVETVNGVISYDIYNEAQFALRDTSYCPAELRSRVPCFLLVRTVRLGVTPC